jgi:hypothetical protein
LEISVKVIARHSATVDDDPRFLSSFSLNQES